MAFEEFPEYPSLADAIEAADKVTVRWDGFNRIRHLSAAQVAAIVSALRASGSESAPANDDLLREFYAQVNAIHGDDACDGRTLEKVRLRLGERG